MVVRGNFTVHLVDPKTKQPFKEHHKDGQTYIEVEPGAEYFISLKKTSKSDRDLLTVYHVDGKDLG